jgi:hypothetical protein
VVKIFSQKRVKERIKIRSKKQKQLQSYFLTKVSVQQLLQLFSSGNRGVWEAVKRRISAQASLHAP